MLTFSDNQMGGFSQDLLHRFVQELAERARERHPARAADFPGQALVEALKGEVDAARALGLKTRAELRRFSDLSMTFGLGFSRDLDWAREIFSRPGMQPKDRLKEVENASVFIVRRQRDGFASS